MAKYDIRKSTETGSWYNVYKKTLFGWRKYPYGRRSVEEAYELMNELQDGETKFPDSNFIRWIKSIPETINACILCIRFPFLYPRNRWTDKHYNNWTITNFHHKWYKYTQDNFFMRFITEKPEKLEYTCDFDDRRYRVDYNENRIWIVDINNCNKVVWSANKSDFGTGKIVKTGWVDKSPYCIVDENWKPNEEINRFIVITHAKWLKNLIKFFDWIHDYPLQWFHCIPTYTELDGMEPGWRKAFGIQYMKELKKQLKKDKMLFKWRIMDIKEKWGQCQLYCNYGSDNLYKIIDKYEELSYKTCINCGKPATKISTGWISPYCDDCIGDRSFTELDKNPFAD